MAFAEETQDMYYKKQSFPMQSAIAYLMTDEGLKKRYYHNISRVDTVKDYRYTSKINNII